MAFNPRVKERVLCHEIKDYARLVEVALLAERGIRKSAAPYDLERRTKQQASHLAKRSTIGSGSKPSVGRSLPPVVGNLGPPLQRMWKSSLRKVQKWKPELF
jgi:hypothetical protein